MTRVPTSHDPIVESQTPAAVEQNKAQDEESDTTILAKYQSFEDPQGFAVSGYSRASAASASGHVAGLQASDTNATVSIEVPQANPVGGPPSLATKLREANETTGRQQATQIVSTSPKTEQSYSLSPPQGYKEETAVKPDTFYRLQWQPPTPDGITDHGTSYEPAYREDTILTPDPDAPLAQFKDASCDTSLPQAFLASASGEGHISVSASSSKIIQTDNEPRFKPVLASLRPVVANQTPIAFSGAKQAIVRRPRGRPRKIAVEPEPHKVDNLPERDPVLNVPMAPVRDPNDVQSKDDFQLMNGH